MRVFRWHKKAVLLLAACVTGVWLLVSWFTADFSCSHTESLQLLHQLVSRQQGTHCTGKKGKMGGGGGEIPFGNFA